MKSHRQELWFHAGKRRELFRITETRARRPSWPAACGKGWCSSTPCTSPRACSSTTTRAACTATWERWLEKLAPEKPYSQYEHNGGEDNADAHLKRTIMGREVVVAITAGKLDLGPWEQIFYYELDGLRDKRVLVKIIGE